MPDYALGLDLGGTNIRAAIVTRSGQIIARQRLDTPYMDGHMALPAALVEAMDRCARPLLDAYPVAGVGAGCGGQFDPHSGIMRGIHTGHPGFVDYPFGAALAERFGLPAWIDNDVKMAALGELLTGAGRDYRHWIGVAVGTGIGGALVLDGKLWHGAGGLAGHLGQTPDPASGQYIEAIAGGVPLGRRAVAAGLLPEGAPTRALFAQARAGDTAAGAFIAEAGRALGRVLAGLAHAIEPEAILLGGTVGLQAEMLAAVQAGLIETLMPNWQHIPLVPMALGPDAAQIGAGLRVFAGQTSA